MSFAIEEASHLVSLATTAARRNRRFEFDTTNVERAWRDWNDDAWRLAVKDTARAFIDGCFSVADLKRGKVSHEALEILEDAVHELQEAKWRCIERYH